MQIAPKPMPKIDIGWTPKAGLTAKAGSAFSISTMLCSSPQNGNIYYQFNILRICGHQVKAAPPSSTATSSSRREETHHNMTSLILKLLKHFWNLTNHQASQANSPCRHYQRRSSSSQVSSTRTNQTSGTENGTEKDPMSPTQTSRTLDCF